MVIFITELLSIIMTGKKSTKRKRILSSGDDVIFLFKTFYTLWLILLKI
jgi:hypothetical protein